MSINFKYNYPQVARDAGFKLRQYKDGPLDWRLLGSLEVERILQDQRLEQIDGALSHLAETPLAALLDTNILDSGIAKYFILSQYAIQYLVFCRKFLDETVRELRDAHAASQLDLAQARKSLTEANNEILQLHKKITQIEAIHEVVYPCHLCTKSFVSNESLNIHIGRRHAARMADARRADTPASGPKEREHNDLNLINTIKLELEIKQLKERLNNAERDIRERSTATSKRTTPREPERGREMRHIGIQNNLMEAKEQDDESLEEDSAAMRERKQQLAELQRKIHDFEQWRETQQLNNEESIAEINKKLSEIVQALEASKAAPPTLPIRADAEDKSAMQRRVSPSVEDLEQLLTQKVAEIGRKSAEKLEEVVYNLEVNYKEKLNELEREIKKRDGEIPAESQTAVAIEMRPPVGGTTTKAMVTNLSLDESDSTTFSESTNEQVALKKNSAKRNAAADSRRTRKAQLVSATKHKRNDDTYEIEPLHGKPKSQELGNRRQEGVNAQKKPDTISTESNRTFTKLAKNTKALERNQSIDVANDSTDITDSLSEESKSDTSSTATDTEPASATSRTKHAKPKMVAKEEEVAATVKQQHTERQKPREPALPKQCTRMDAQRMLNRRLAAQGLDVKGKYISNAAMKRAMAELDGQRSKLKMKYPHFYVTRNKIKKLVDKLCSTQLPAQADYMLTTKKPLKPLEPAKPERPSDSPRSPAGSSFEMLEMTSTPLQPRDSDNFKQRLERILASPVQKPEKSAEPNVLTTAQIHATPTGNKPLPVPMARKRVMFNTRASETPDNMNT